MTKLLVFSHTFLRQDVRIRKLNTCEEWYARTPELIQSQTLVKLCSLPIAYANFHLLQPYQVRTTKTWGSARVRPFQVDPENRS